MFARRANVPPGIADDQPPRQSWYSRKRAGTAPLEGSVCPRIHSFDDVRQLAFRPNSLPTSTQWKGSQQRSVSWCARDSHKTDYVVETDYVDLCRYFGEQDEFPGLQMRYRRQSRACLMAPSPAPIETDVSQQTDMQFVLDSGSQENAILIPPPDQDELWLQDIDAKPPEILATDSYGPRGEIIKTTKLFNPFKEKQERRRQQRSNAFVHLEDREARLEAPQPAPSLPPPADQDHHGADEYGGDGFVQRQRELWALRRTRRAARGLCLVEESDDAVEEPLRMYPTHPIHIGARY